MDKGAIKNFAVWARRKLIEDITQKAFEVGVAEDKIADAVKLASDAIQVNGRLLQRHEAKQRESLIARIRERGFQEVIEEAAYTWFNRLIAVRFMEINGYLPTGVRVLSSAEKGKAEPDIISSAHYVDLDQNKELVDKLLDEHRADELFRYLFVKQCNKLGEILPNLFETIEDYTELLLPNNLLFEGSVARRLVSDIVEEDFRDQVEIIGWLYQYYISEKKDEVFAALKRNVKITKENIPAATQLFTPDWIVKYMVENSLGRLWLEGHPDDSLKANWKYYLDGAEQEPDVQKQLDEIREQSKKIRPEEIKVLDPCMGSGHILVYAFDVLFDIYKDAGYSEKEIPKLILEHNLYGLEIDDRAAQLAYFAVMMKARQYNRRILKGETNHHVYAIQESNGINRNQLQYFGAGMDEVQRNISILQIQGLLDIFIDAKEYGSILNVDSYDWRLLHQFVKSTDTTGQLSLDTIDIEDTQEQLRLLVEIGAVMVQKYDVVVTNPPYMGSSGMSNRLSNHVKTNFPNGKNDLFACFIEKSLEMLKDNGITGLMTSYTWMFLTAFTTLREYLVDNVAIYSLIQPEYHAFFQEAFVPICTFVLRNSKFDYYGKYIRLEDFTGAEQQNVRALEAINNNDCGYLYKINQKEFKRIPCFPIAYWLNVKTINLFENKKALSEYVELRQGLITGDNDRFLRFWYECDKTKVTTSKDLQMKWYFYHKGGEFKKWYGNIYLVVNWENDGYEISNFRDSNGRLRSRPQNVKYYQREGFTWTALTVADFNARYMPDGAIFDAKGSSGFCSSKEDLLYFIAMCNAKPCMKFLSILSPTMDYNAGAVSKVPAIVDNTYAPQIIRITENCIQLAKQDWDSFETSWDFDKHPLIYGTETIAKAFNKWQAFTETEFNNLKVNEEELNRIFIDIYDLQDELTPEVNDKDVTIRKADLERDIRSLVSYAVGCMFGRYSLDAQGIAYAGGSWDDGKYNTFIPDMDNIIPITEEEYFEDDIVGLFVVFVKKVYGAEALEENLDFIAKALGSKGDTSREIIRNYILKDFFKDHCRVYQKRPIYWLFDSGPEDGFKALIYMHRYDEFTVAKVRTDYLHKLQKMYDAEIKRLDILIDSDVSPREKATAIKRREKIQKQIRECLTYDQVIAHVANQRINIDLDDGVKVNYAKFQGVEIPQGEGRRPLKANLLANI